MRKYLVIAAALFAALSCSSDRSQVLKVYNWADYIGIDVIGDFEEWYEAQTGEKVKVVYQTFDVNETMLTKIEKGQEDFDVVCPSDYITERMLKNDMLIPLDMDALPDSIDYITPNTSPFMLKMLKEINPEKDASKYVVPYMWGTTGLIYNAAYVTDEEASTWDVLRNPKFKDQVFMKDAPRDMYSPILIFLKQKELASGEVTMEELMWDSSDESLAAVEAFLKDCKDNVLGWEADFGKDQLILGHGVISVNWSGDGYWSREQAKPTGVDLRYQVPKEGSNFWFDGWVIPKYAKNVKAATYFIDYMCRPDIVIRNMEETGYLSASGSWEVLESQIDEDLDPIDLSYFFGEGAESVRVDSILYPDKSVIEHCAMEHDWGDDTDKLLAMWARVKGDNASSLTYIIIGLAILAIIAAVLFGKKSQKRRRKAHRR